MIDLRKMIVGALEAAVATREKRSPPKETGRRRSRNFVRELSEAFERAYPDACVFSRPSQKHRDEFGISELLHDILVARTDETNAVMPDVKIPFVSAPLWQVESELNGSTRAAVKDFAKLALGCARNKLFVGRLFAREAQVLATFQPVARAAESGGSKVYAAFIPRPRDWKTRPLEVRVFELRRDGWELLDS